MKDKIRRNKDEEIIKLLKEISDKLDRLPYPVSYPTLPYVTYPYPFPNSPYFTTTSGSGK